MEIKIDKISSPETLLKILKDMGYATFEKTKWDVNIIGIRRVPGKVNSFDDRAYLICKNDSDKLQMWSWSITTDPGTYWLKSPGNVLGTAILKAGQYRGTWELGLHKGKPGLVQVKPVTVWRDSDRDSSHDLGPASSTGLYGINLHRAGKSSVLVDKWSAGCQVWAKESDYEDFYALCKKQVKETGYKTFTYTLLEESE